jgi:uncharacterized protein
MLELTLNGEQVQLLPEGALYWERAGTLVIADPHFGKDDIFRRAGVAIPRGPTLRDLERVGNTVRATHARRLIIVGDFVHGRSERGDDLPRQFALWRRRHPDLPVLLVAGNHDRHEDWTAWREVLEVRAGSLHEGPFVFAHEPQADPRGYVLAGHLHPVFREPMLGSKALRVFWQRAQCLVLPSWGEFTGGWRVRPAPGDGLHACTPEGVLTLQTGKPT